MRRHSLERAPSERNGCGSVTPAGFVVRQLRARPLRTALTSGAFALSTGLLGFLLVLNDALQRDWSPNQAQRVIVMAKGSLFDRLPAAYEAKIAVDGGVAAVVPFDFVLSFWKDTRPENQVPLSASPAETLLKVYGEADVPPAEAAAWLADPTGSVIGPVLAKKYGWKPGDRIVLKAPVKGGVVETTIRGVMRYRLDNGVYLHRSYFEHLTGDPGKASMFWILARSRAEVEPLTQRLRKTFENAPAPVDVMTEKQWQLMFMQMIGNVKALIGSIGLATAFALLLVTANSLAMSARERKGESAVLRVLGFSRSRVASLLLAEAGLYGAAGAVFGTVLIFVFGKFVGAALDETQFAGIGGLLVPTLRTVLAAVAASSLLGLVAGVVPAFGLVHRPLAEVLREGT